jgi:hypothetical protein
MHSEKDRDHYSGSDETTLLGGLDGGLARIVLLLHG